MLKIIRKSTYNKMKKEIESLKKNYDLLNSLYKEEKAWRKDAEKKIAEEKEKRSLAAKKGAVTRAKNKAMKNLETP